MNSKLWIQRALSTCLVFAVIVTYSIAALANTGKIAGELSVAGQGNNGGAPSILVNGEPAQSGRSIFSASTIATPDNASAVINLGKIGKVQLAPSTNLVLSFTEKGISGDSLSGKLTVVNASDIVSVKTAGGEILKLNAGDSATAASGKVQDDDDDDNDGGAAWLPWALVFGGAVAAIVIATVVTDNETQLSGGSIVVSATR